MYLYIVSYSQVGAIKTAWWVNKSGYVPKAMGNARAQGSWNPPSLLGFCARAAPKCFSALP